MAELEVKLPDIHEPLQLENPKPVELCKRCGCRPERVCHRCGVDTDMCSICQNEHHTCAKPESAVFDRDRRISMAALSSAVSGVLKIAANNALATLTKDDLDRIKADYEGQLAEKQKKIMGLLEEQKQMANRHRDEMTQLIEHFNSAQECTKETIAKLEEELKDMKMKTTDKDTLKKNLDRLAQLPKLKRGGFQGSSSRPSLTTAEGEQLSQEKSTNEPSTAAITTSLASIPSVPKFGESSTTTKP